MSLLDDARRPGDIVGPWRIVAVLGRGGWGTVYSAVHPPTGRTAAVKVLSPEVCKHQAAIKRFRREAQATSAIGHANVVEVVETGELPDGSDYYAMELLSGESLAETLKRESCLPWLRVRHIILQLCAALAAAHAKGVVHRDLKPANCFRITRDDDPDFIKLLDFGVAKILSSEISELTSLTKTGDFLGTTAFMAPEQILGEKIDHRVDLHALGVLIYVLLTGTLPYGGTVASQVIVAIVQNAAAPMSMIAPAVEISEAMEQVVARALQKDPRKRFQSAAEMGAAIAAIVAPAVARSPAAPLSGLAMAPTVAAGGPEIDALAATEGAEERPRTVVHPDAWPAMAQADWQIVRDKQASAEPAPRRVVWLALAITVVVMLLVVAGMIP